MPTINVGPLDKQIRFLKKIVKTDSTYGPGGQATWIPWATVWANVQDVMPSRDESLPGGNLEVSSVKARVRFRYRPDIDSSMRVEVLHSRSRFMEIIGGPVEISDRKSYMEIMCEEISTSE